MPEIHDEPTLEFDAIEQIMECQVCSAKSGEGDDDDNFECPDFDEDNVKWRCINCGANRWFTVEELMPW